MSTAFSTVADLLERLGSVPPERIRLVPAPGQATVDDLLRVLDGEGLICELVDGVLVEKAMGWYESRVAAALIYFLEHFLSENDLGVVAGADGVSRILPDRIRAPDVAFFRWERFPDRNLPRERVPDLAPDLAVEVLSKSNTPNEMEGKVEEYLRAGASLVWLIDAETESVRVFSRDGVGRDGAGILDGSNLLPGFELSLGALFERAGRRG